jgi:hypothetical protein
MASNINRIVLVLQQHMMNGLCTYVVRLLPAATAGWGICKAREGREVYD